MALDRSTEEKSSLSVGTPHHPFGFTRKRSTSKFGYNKPKESSRQNKLYIEEASKLEKLGEFSRIQNWENTKILIVCLLRIYQKYPNFFL